MTELEYFDYTEKPYTKLNNFTVHPLTDLGHNQYVQKESYPRTYINKITPRILEGFNTKRQNEIENVTLNKDFIKEFQNPENVNDLNQNDKENENYLQETIKNNFLLNDAEEIPANEKKRAQTSHSFFRPKPVIQQGNSQNSFNPIIQRFNETTGFNQNFKKKKLWKNCKESIKDTRFNKDYQVQLKKISSKLSGNETNRTISKSKMKNCFESYNVPRINDIVFNPERKKRTLTANYNNRMRNTLNSFSLSREKNLNTTKGDDSANSQDISLICEKENERLRDILLKQTNQWYLKEARLPKISYIISQPKILMTKNNQQFSKNMGEKYNPFNYQQPQKNSLRRNVFGAPFNY